MTTSLYTSETCREPAYQLNWTYTLFWHSPPSDEAWLPPLQAATEADGIRILQHELTQPTTSQFLVSTTPSVSPQLVVQRVKGSLQYILRPHFRNASQRNDALRSVGSANREAINAYIAGQLEHHPMSDPLVAAKFETCRSTLALATRFIGTACISYWTTTNAIGISIPKEMNNTAL